MGGVYIEAGANDGVSHSNTLRLDHTIWSGMLIEPSKVAFDQLKLNRPNEILINYALVGDSSLSFISGTFENGSLMGSAHPVLMKRDTLPARNNFEKLLSFLRVLLRLPPKIKKSTVKAATLDSLLTKNKISRIDLFILDIEGQELEILKTFSFNPKPRIIVVETRSGDASEIADVMLEARYVLAGNFSNFSKERNPSFSGDHQDYIWVDSAEISIVKTVSETDVFYSKEK